MKLFIYIISNILQLQIRELRHHPYDHLEELPGWVCVRSPLVYRKCIQVTHNPLEEDAESYAQKAWRVMCMWFCNCCTMRRKSFIYELIRCPVWGGGCRTLSSTLSLLICFHSDCSLGMTWAQCVLTTVVSIGHSLLILKPNYLQSVCISVWLKWADVTEIIALKAWGFLVHMIMFM